jgi:2-oxoglutarate ferredoxin oxidoreductase subunit alpha
MPLGRIFRDDISIVLAGEAGQGIQTIEVILSRVLKRAGLNVFGTKEYMSRVRGGTNTTEIRIASEPVAAFVDRIDIFIPLDDKAIPHVKSRLTEKTLIVGDAQTVHADREILDVPFLKLATEIGGEIFSNMIAAGFLTGLLGIEVEIIIAVLEEIFGKKAADIIEKNRLAARKGFDLARAACAEHRIVIELKRDPAVAGEILISGHEAVALGATAGGCNFLASYPMSPSTGVLTFLAQHALDFGIVVEQAEDEIAAMNMGLGSWYAGGRAMVTTSGGGFALMAEGLSLAGAIESPMVIHLAQRPGPATGLPTRTEQGDLEFALHAGHGEFPRVILTPGTVQDAFFCAAHAFYLADKYQVPVFILTDQYLMDSYYNVKEFPAMPEGIKNYFVETGPDYQRYAKAKNGVSPRGIPGFGKGIVCVDSDEHDEGGYITEDAHVRTAMVDKRLKKSELLSKEVLEPELFSRGKNYKKLVVGWGSTHHVIREALWRKTEKDTAYLYLPQVYPFPEQAMTYFHKVSEVICVENNATGQLADIIRRETGFAVHRKVLKYNGLPFSVEELTEKI